MKRAALLFCLSFLFCKGFSQQAAIDSLKLAIQEHPQENTLRLDMLIDLVFYYKDTDPARGIATANEAIRLSERLNDQGRLATVYNYAGLNYAAQGNDSTALRLFDKCLAIRRQLHDDTGIASAIHNAGISYFNLSDYPHALEYQHQAYDILKEADDKTGMAAALKSIGVVFLYLSEYPKALSNYLEALHIYEHSGDEKNMANALTDIGLVYDHLDNYSKSLEYHLKALEIYKKYDDLYHMQNTLGNIGNVYDNSGNPGKALSFYEQAKKINEKLGNNRGIASNLTNTGIVYNGTSDYGTSLNYLEKALELYRRLNDKYGMSIALSYISNAYLRAPDKILIGKGISPSERYTKAIEAQQKGLLLAQETGNLNSESEAWGNLSEIYEEKKDFSRSLEAYKKYAVLHDSIFNSEKRSAITQMSMQYEFDKKEAQTQAAADKKEALAAAEINRQQVVRNSIAAGAVILLSAAILVFVFYKRKRDAVELRNEAEFKAKVADTEMKALRAQMNPHFIFNSLNSISDYIGKHDIQTADRYLAKFAKMMRMILENSEHKQISLAEDLRTLELYMQLEAFRLNDKFSYEIRVDKQIDQDITMVPPLILQPFVENSIWHGIAQKEEKGKILIEIKKEDKMINCMIEDNGVGRKHPVTDRQNPHVKKSLGMKITMSRIDIMNHPQKTKSNVELFDLAKGTRVEVKFPLALNF